MDGILSPSPDFNPPVIIGSTTVNETDTLILFCDTSNSQPLPSVKWVDSQGNVLSIFGQLTIEDIHRNDTGTYTCQATESNLQMTLSESVNVTVQCELREW